MEAIKRGVLGLLLFTFFSMHVYAEKTRIIENFDNDWLFKRYGLQADETSLEEPILWLDQLKKLRS